MSFKRENKNRPREISSKKPVPVFRDVFQLKKKHIRDPRFDDLSGKFNSESFEENYSFIGEIRKREKEELENELSNIGDNIQRKAKIKILLERMKNQDKARKLLKKQKEEELKIQEEVMEAAKSGKKPYIPKKSELKKKQLVETFQSLQKSGKLDKYIERKRKKQFFKDKRRFYK